MLPSRALHIKLKHTSPETWEGPPNCSESPYMQRCKGINICCRNNIEPQKRTPARDRTESPTAFGLSQEKQAGKKEKETGRENKNGYEADEQ